MVTHSCYHMPVGSHNVVIEHCVGTQSFYSTLYSGLDVVSFPSVRTSALGLELGTRLWFVDWITGEIAPLSILATCWTCPFWEKPSFLMVSACKQNCVTSPFGKPALKLWESLLMKCSIACQMPSWHNAQIAIGGSNNPDPTHNFLSTTMMKSTVHADTGDVCTGMQSRSPPALTSQSMTKESAQHTQLPQILLGAMFV